MSQVRIAVLVGRRTVRGMESIVATEPIPKALAAALNGTLDPAAATKQAQADLEQIAQSIT